MRSALVILVFCMLAATSVRAGAWLREPGTVFSSVSTTVRYLDGIWRPDYSLYAEYGLAPRLTLGVDYNENPGFSGHVMMFARMPVGSTQRRTKLALELGIGGHHWQGQWAEMFKSTISLGRGFSSRWGDGWFHVDGAMEMRRPNPEPAYKLDATLGLSSGLRFRPLLQFESTYIPGTPLIWSLIPSVMIDGRDDTTWLIGVERRTAGQTSLGLRFALWRRF